MSRHSETDSAQSILPRYLSRQAVERQIRARASMPAPRRSRKSSGPTRNRTENLLIKSEPRDMAGDGRSRRIGTSRPANRDKTEWRYPMTDRKWWDLCGTGLGV